MDLFDKIDKENIPLSERMRGVSFNDFIGQTHIVNNNSLIYRSAHSGKLGNCIFYGPPGTGKTTLAYIIANTTGSVFEKLNAVTSGVSDIKKIVDEARLRLSLYGKKTYLILDECHRWSKTQSDSLLYPLEKGDIIFIGTTTENPYSTLTKALLSRCRVFEFKKLSESEILLGLKRSINDKINGFGNYQLIADEAALKYIAKVCNGDLRYALNALESAVITSKIEANAKIHITLSDAKNVTMDTKVSIDKQDYYDLLSAFGKSLRGSDADAALFYAFTMIENGIDPRVVLRRLIVHASEDIGLADSQAFVIASNTLDAFERIGVPEGLIPLAHAIIYVAMAPKSNSVILALESVKKAVSQNYNVQIPSYLRDKNFRVDEALTPKYLYPHDFPGGWVNQQYLPDEIKNLKFYKPSSYGEEKNIKIKENKNE